MHSIACMALDMQQCNKFIAGRGLYYIIVRQVHCEEGKVACSEIKGPLLKRGYIGSLPIEIRDSY